MTFTVSGLTPRNREEIPTEVIMTEDELRERCRYWQEILSLQPWRIIVKLVRSKDIPGHGQCTYNLECREAMIKILDHVDWDRDLWQQDMEETLVHELLHLHMAPFDAKEGTLEETMQEQAIEAIAVGLLKVKRGA